MKKVMCLLLLIGTVLPITLFSQNSLQTWSSGYQIIFDDFHDQAPRMINDGNQMFHLHLIFDIDHSSSNPIARLYFDRDKSWIEPGDETDFLVDICNMQFDLAEIYLRKIQIILRSSFQGKEMEREQLILEELRSFYDEKVRMVSEIIISNFDLNLIQQYKRLLHKRLNKSFRP